MCFIYLFIYLLAVVAYLCVQQSFHYSKNVTKKQKNMD